VGSGQPCAPWSHPPHLRAVGGWKGKQRGRRRPQATALAGSWGAQFPHVFLVGPVRRVLAMVSKWWSTSPPSRPWAPTGDQAQLSSVRLATRCTTALEVLRSPVKWYKGEHPGQLTNANPKWLSQGSKCGCYPPQPRSCSMIIIAQR